MKTTSTIAIKRSVLSTLSLLFGMFLLMSQTAEARNTVTTVEQVTEEETLMGDIDYVITSASEPSQLKGASTLSAPTMPSSFSVTSSPA